MGRGVGCYNEKQDRYKDTAGHKVKDTGSIFIAERYIDQGYEVIFNPVDPPNKTFDLTIKDSSNSEVIKNIEVKQVVSNNPSKIASNIKKANEQINENDTIAIYLSTKSYKEGINFANVGISEAKRKDIIKGPIEVWFKDKIKVEYGKES